MTKWKDLIPKPRSKFFSVKCPDCGNEQVIFESAAMVVKCNVCDSVLAEPSGGKVKVRGEVVNVFE